MVLLIWSQILLFPLLLDNILSTDIPKCSHCDVQGLTAEGDYRAVKLSWRFVRSLEPPAFRVKYCETSQWQSKRCRQKILPLDRAINGKGKLSYKELPPQLILDRLIRMEKGSYQTIITDLRMITNYSFAVEAEFHDWRESSRHYHPSDNEHFPVFVETKGFTGRTIKCLGNVSEVAVNTGPYFGGKISVEGATADSCYLYGNHSSPLEVYTMTINHGLCGSKVNNNSIETTIVVHENREILTHNSRRFLVVCNYPREYFTLSAFVDVPPHLLKKKNKHETESLPRLKPVPVATEDPNQINFFDKYKFSRMRDSRILADTNGPKFLLREQTIELRRPVVVISGVLLVTSVLGIVAWIWRNTAQR